MTHSQDHVCVCVYIYIYIYIYIYSCHVNLINLKFEPSPPWPYGESLTTSLLDLMVKVFVVTLI
jgi:hypothetical protein